MVCSIAKPYTQINEYAESHYQSLTQSISNSFWYGSGANRLGLTGQISPNDYNNLYQGKDTHGTSLRRVLSNQNFIPGRDLTFSAPKSVSLLGLVQPQNDVIQAQNSAVKTALDYAEKNCIFTRAGKAGKFHQQTDNAVIATFLHDSNRHHDPQLHTHCVIFNLTQGQDAKWRSMDNRQLYQQKMTLGAVYHHQLGRELQQLGYSLDWSSDSTFDVRGYSHDQLGVFSSRRQEIIDAVGKDAPSATKALACLQTRPSKVYLSREQQQTIKQDWHEKVRTHSLNHPQPNHHLQRPTRQFFQNLTSNFRGRFLPISENCCIDQAISILSHNNSRSTFSRPELLQKTLQLSQGKYELHDLQTEIENHPDLIHTENGKLTTPDLLAKQKNQNLEPKQQHLDLNSEHIQVQEIPENESKLNTVVRDFVNRNDQKRNQTIVLTDTQDAKKHLSERIRQELISHHQLSITQREIYQLQPRNLGKLSLSQLHNYSVGDLIKFNRQSAKFNKDLYYRVEKINLENGILQLRDKDNQLHDLPANRYLDREVFSPHQLEIRLGEVMQFTRTHYHDQVKRTAGQSFSIIDLTDDGQIEIQTNGKTFSVAPEQLFFSDYRYVDTLDNYQGKTANYSLYAPSDDTSSPELQNNLALASSISTNQLTVYTNDSQSLGLYSNSIQNSYPLSISPIEPPTRSQEFELLLASKYLIEHHRDLNPTNNDVQTFQSSDGLEITRTSDSLTISHDGAQLVFDSHNATIIDTFDSNQIDLLIESLGSQMLQHQQQIELTQSHSRSISIDL